MDKTIEQLRKDIEKMGPSYAYDDAGMGERFVTVGTNKLLQIKQDDKWAHWSGFRWIIDEPGHVYNNVRDVEKEVRGEWLIFNTAMEMYDRALFKEANDDIGKVADIKKRDPHWKKICGLADASDKAVKYIRSVKGNTCMLNQAAAHGGLKIDINEFDSKGQFIGVKNGVLNLKTLELVAGKPEYRITKTVGASWNMDAKCPEWEKLLTQITGGDSDMKRFLQRVAGSMMLEEKKDKMVIMHSSKGGYGKSTFADTVLDVLGEYGKAVASKMIISDVSSKEYYLASLRGVRAIVMNETAVDTHLAGELVKTLIDSGPVQARMPRGEPFQIDPKFTAVLTTNSVPNMGGDDALWRRMLIVPFEHMIPVAERNPKYRDEVLKKEYDGILAWLVEGCVEYQKMGFNPPKKVVDATQDERSAQDKIDQFIAGFCDVEDGAVTPLVTFRKLYGEWCAENGMQAESSITLRKKLVMKGYDVKPVGANVMSVKGLKFVVEVKKHDSLDDIRDPIQKMIDERKKRDERDRVAKLVG